MIERGELMHLLYPIAKRYIAGEDLPTALRSIAVLGNGGYLATLDILGENTTNAEQATLAKRQYLDLIGEFERKSAPMDFSIKLTQMGLDISESLCRDNVREILCAAQHHTVRFDIEGSAYTERTIKTAIDMHKDNKNLGQAVQAYLHRSKDDVDELIRNGVSVRICKGAYKEPASIAYQSMDVIRDNYLSMAYKLLKEGNKPAIATHDEYLIGEIINFTTKEKIDKGSFYFEMLYGVGRDLQKILLQKGYQVRIYVPFGKSWLPYTLRRLSERKENILFVLRHLFRETFGLRKIS